MSNQYFSRQVLSVLLAGSSFVLVSGLQRLLFPEVDTGVSTPYLPAGVRLVAAAVFGFAGCVGLFLGSLVVAAEIFPGASWAEWTAVACVSAFVPLLALTMVRRTYGIGEQLLELSFRSLLVLVALQSVLSPLAHQLVFAFTGMAPASLYNLLAMVAGDAVGCMLVVLLAAYVWSWRHRR